MLTSGAAPCGRRKYFLEGQVAFSHTRLSNNRSVMPLDVRGCTRATLSGSSGAYPALTDAGNPLNPTRDRDWGLQLFPMNEEFPVSAVHKLALIKSLPFVHTARRYYRLDGLVRAPRGPRVPRRGWGVGLGLSPPPTLTHSQDGCGPPSARLRVPNSSPSSGGRGGVQCLPCPVLGGERPESFVSGNPLSTNLVASNKNERQLLAVDHSARASMKNAASCEK
uniref:Uncharacterized protein n=1 Tax=Gasterosteus aculeatus aculeatus TaxID=481459 RepID=A0AAQ4QCW3_GASAC